MDQDSFVTSVFIWLCPVPLQKKILYTGFYCFFKQIKQILVDFFYYLISYLVEIIYMILFYFVDKNYVPIQYSIQYNIKG